MLWIVGFWATISKISTLEDTEHTVFWYSYPRWLTNGYSKTNSFPERTQKNLPDALKCFAYNVANILLLSAKKYETSVIFWHFNDHNHFNNILITGSKKWTNFFIYFSSSISWYISFCISKPWKFSKVFQIAVEAGARGKLPPPQWEEIWNFTGGDFFYQANGTWEGMILAIQTFFKAKNSFPWILNIN